MYPAKWEYNPQYDRLIYVFMKQVAGLPFYFTLFAKLNDN